MIRPPDVVDVTPGPMLLSGIADGPSLAAHRVRQGPLPEADAGALLAVLAPLAVRGRGGAGFPLARKIDTVLAHRSRRPGRRPVVVVNAARLARIPGRPGMAAGGDAAPPLADADLHDRVGPPRVLDRVTDEVHEHLLQGLGRACGGPSRRGT